MIQLITLFSGIGGPELAAEMLNEKYGEGTWVVVASCEIADFPRRVLEYYWPDAYHHTDIRTLNYETLVKKSNWNPKLPTVIIGGFPCQPFSVAGRRSGSDDNRFLWPEMQRVIAEVRPVAVIGENVAGLLSMVQPGRTIKVESTADLFSAQNSVSGNGSVGKSKKTVTKESRYITDEICESLEQAGYETIPVVIPACAVGAPHRRDRIFFVAYRSDTGIESVRKQKVEADKLHLAADAENNGLSQSGNSWKRGSGFENDNSEVTSNTPSNGLQGGGNSRKLRKEGALRNKRLAHVGCLSGENWKDFPTQSPVRERNDGISNRMAGYITNNLYDAISKTSQENRIENLHEVWKCIQQEEIWKQIRRFYTLESKEVLFQTMQLYSTGVKIKVELSPFSAELSEGVLSTLRKHGEFRYSPRGSKLQEQRSVKFGNTLSFLPHEVALAARSFETAISKLASKLRNDSIKAYGNAIVPQVIMQIMEGLQILINEDYE